MINKLKQFRRKLIAQKCFKNDFKNIILKYNEEKNNYKNVRIMNDNDTINYMLENKVSICRYGDGEFKWLLGVKEVPGFQKVSNKLSKRLEEIIKDTNNKKILICIPNYLNNQDDATIKANFFWKHFNVTYRKDVDKYLNNKYSYGNSNLTRPYMDYKNKKVAKERFDNIKKIWKNRNLIIIEGNKTRLGVGNDLFNNSKSIKRIICPGQNAFDKYDEILEKSLQHISKEDLILIALGPTATVLAYDLGNLDYQALDIGHIDVEYEWFLKGAKEKVSIANKAVNEVGNFDNVINEEDQEYKKSIIEIIK
ncbi:MAG: SP_1767 family glycosyltransferase [Bacilli bacterium]|nr:SP_1767 family glycosyltransferase [Bacilli bacterium]